MSAEGEEVVVREHPVAAVTRPVAVHRGIERAAMATQKLAECVFRRGEEDAGLLHRVDGRDRGDQLFEASDTGFEVRGPCG